MVGDKYSIADMANYSWVNFATLAGIDLEKFTNLHAWWKRVNARPAVQKGISIPGPSTMTNDAFKKRLQDEPETKQKNEELHEHLKKAQEQYNYKFSSP